MIIAEMRIHPYRIPFRQPFATAHGTLLAREGAIVELVADDGTVGVGDMAAVTEFGAPDVATLVAAAIHIRPTLLGMSGEEIYTNIYESALGQGIFVALPAPLLFALETSINALFRYTTMRWPIEKQDAVTFHGWQYKPVRVNATIGAVHIADAVAAAITAQDADFTCIKLKVGMVGDIDAEVERIEAVRAAIDPAIHIRLDANEAWSFDQAYTVIQRIQHIAIQYIEQPLARDDLAGMQQLREMRGIPIAADEALTDYASIRHKKDIADIFIVKPQLLGGQSITERVARHFKRQKQLVLTTSLESGIGVAATLAISNYPIFHFLECGLATLPLLEDDLICETLTVRDGMMYPPTTPVTPDWDAIARYRLEVPGL